MKEIESRVLKAVKDDPLASQQELADRLGMSRESVAGHIMRLTRRGKILGKGYIVPNQDNIVVLGGCNLDISGHSSHAFLPEDSNPGQVRQSPGGVGRNIAENLARLGHPVSLLSIVGQDQPGTWLLEQSRAAGINMDDVIRHPDFSTSTYLAVNDHQGQLVAAIADMQIVDSLTDQLLASKLSLLQSARVVLVEANLSESCLEWLAKQSLSGDLYADAVSQTKAVRLRPLLNKIHTLKVNREEAKAILDLKEADDRTLIQGLLAAGVQRVALSLGAEGLCLANAEQSCRYPVFPTQAVSDTGAGDALIAGVLHAQLTDWSLPDSTQFALACAGITLECPHANHPELTENYVTNWMKKL